MTEWVFGMKQRGTLTRQWSEGSHSRGVGVWNKCNGFSGKIVFISNNSKLKDTSLISSCSILDM